MLRNELSTLFRRRRTQAMLAALAVVPVLISVVVRLSGGPSGGEGPRFLSQVTHNGVFAVLAGLTVMLPIFLPMAVTVVAGDAIAGEAGLGTLRYLLVRPAGRARLLACKTVAVMAFCLAATATVAVAGLLSGVALFPLERVTTLSGDTLPLSVGMVRIAIAAVLVAVSLLGVAAIGLFVSTMTDVPVGAMAATLALFIGVGVLNALPQVDVIHPFLLTNYWTSYADLLRTEVRWGGIVRNVGLQGLYLAVFGSAAWARLTTKDVLC
ncbi:MAG: ABC transporter permease subunit [Acidimicrobiales bacterium]|nr:ABC transporter permease subunit [Acidimicrobiales bacterium]